MFLSGLRKTPTSGPFGSPPWSFRSAITPRYQDPFDRALIAQARPDCPSHGRGSDAVDDRHADSPVCARAVPGARMTARKQWGAEQQVYRSLESQICDELRLLSIPVCTPGRLSRV